MASDTERDKPTRFSGPRAIGALLPALTRPAFRSRGAASAQLLADWPEIVGAELARTSRPQRLVGTTLTVACAGPIALELQHLAGPLAERINGFFGRQVVERFRFVQAAAATTAAPAVPPLPPRAPPVEVPDMAPSELRDALAALGAAVRQARGGAG